MYINPFVAGVLATLGVEIVLLVLYAVTHMEQHWQSKARRGKGNAKQDTATAQLGRASQWQSTA